MRLVIVSGLSGSGKTVALRMLEDIDFYCVDNIPAALLKPFIAHTVRGLGDTYPRTAVGLDARNRPNEIETIPALVGELRRSGISCEVLYLHASDEVLLKRYAETRRKHPLVAGDVSLREAIASERTLLEPITSAADLVIDTSNMGVHALRELIRERVDRRREGRLSLMFESFGYKHGIPGDADYVFDVRSLPNPYWEHSLRPLNGRDAPVIDYLAGYASVRAMIADLIEFLERRVGEFSLANRSYLTIAIGCTGGQHRSVYIAEQLAAHFRQSYPQVLTRHDSLQKSSAP
jgi:UPF0042 nucleotide-binding protein